MDLRDYGDKYGQGALRKLGEATGLKDYIYQLSSGAKSITLENAKLLQLHAPELDLLKLMEMRARIQRDKSASSEAAA